MRPPVAGQATLFTKPACPLCFTMRRAAGRLARRFRVALRAIDISGDPELERRYGREIPVLVLPGGETFRGRAEADALLEAFRRAARGAVDVRGGSGSETAEAAGDRERGA